MDEVYLLRGKSTKKYMAVVEEGENISFVLVDVKEDAWKVYDFYTAEHYKDALTILVQEEIEIIKEDIIA